MAAPSLANLAEEKLDNCIIVGVLRSDPNILSSFRGFLLLQTLCSVNNAYSSMFNCLDWQVWKAAFDKAVDAPSTPGAEHPAWIRYYSIHMIQTPQAYIASVEEAASDLPSVTDADKERLALFWKDQVKRVILQRVIMGGETSNPCKPAYAPNLIPKMHWMIYQMRTFLDRKNGSPKQILKIMLDWHKSLKENVPDFPKIDIKIATELVYMAAELSEASRTSSNNHVENLPKIIDLLETIW